MGTERACEVLVVGGGPAGLFLAALLAQDGIDVVVLERRAAASTHSRAIGLHPPALAALHTLGLEEQALAEGVMIRAGLARSRGRELGGLTFERAWPDRPYVLALPQHRTEALLTEGLAASSPRALRRGSEVVAVEEDGGRVTVRTVEAPGPAPRQTVWTTQVVVGADGPQSLVRERAGIRTQGRSYPHTYLMGDFEDTTGDGAVAVLYLEPGGIVESFPLPGGVRRWVARTGREPVDASAELLVDIVRRRTGRVPDLSSSTMVSAFGTRRRLAERLVSGRSMILGDAAHEISPIGGQGMTLGWLDALALAPALARVVREAGGGPLHQRPDLRSLEGLRLGSARRAARRAELNMAAGTPLGASGATAREGAVRAVLGTPLRSALARAFTMHRL